MVNNIFSLNDNRSSLLNHWKAVRMVLELVATNPNFELKGTKVSEIVKEKVNEEVTV